MEDVSNFEKAVVHRHNEVGRPLAALSHADIMRGYLPVVGKRIAPNLWRSGGEDDVRPTIDLSHADEVGIEENFNPWSKIITTQHGRVSSIDDVAEEFGVKAKLAQKEKDVWALAGMGIRTPGGGF